MIGRPLTTDAGLRGLPRGIGERWANVALVTIQSRAGERVVIRIEVDVCGTLADPLKMVVYLRPLVDDLAQKLAGP